MEEWYALAGGKTVASNQILYNLARRGPEWDLIPWCRERNISIMAYSPIEQGRMLGHKALAEVAARRQGATPAQVALAWLLRQDGMMVIPKADPPGACARESGRARPQADRRRPRDARRRLPAAQKARSSLGML